VLWQGCTLPGHTDEVHSVTVSPDGKRFASGSNDTLVKIWAAESGVEVSIPLERVEGGEEVGCFLGAFEMEFVWGGVLRFGFRDVLPGMRRPTRAFF